MSVCSALSDESYGGPPRQQEEGESTSTTKINPPTTKPKKPPRNAAEREVINAVKAQDLKSCVEIITVQRTAHPPPRLSFSVLGCVLRLCEQMGDVKQGFTLLESIRTRFPLAMKNEIICVLAMRLLHRAATPVREMFTSLREFAENLAAVNSLKRRLFQPFFERCVEAAAQQSSSASSESVAVASLVFSAFQIADSNHVEIWDADLGTIVEALCADTATPAAEITAGATFVMERVLLEYLPVVGRSTAHFLSMLLLRTPSSEQQQQRTAASSAPAPKTFDGVVDISDSSDGVCPRCGCTLQSFDLSPEDRQLLLNDIVERLVKPQLQRGGGGHKKKRKRSRGDDDDDTSNCDNELRKFAEFERALDEVSASCAAEGARELCLIDAANIGYYALCAWYPTAKREMLLASGRCPDNLPASEFDLASRRHKFGSIDVPLNFAFVDSTVRAALDEGFWPVVIWNERHEKDPSQMTAEGAAIIEQWNKIAAANGAGRRVLIAAPQSINDDHAWLYGSVRCRAKVVTNDLMRDHHYGMLSQRSFLRWRGAFRIGFHITTTVSRGVKVWLHHPPPFSVAAQRGSSAAAGGGHWHIPFDPDVESVPQSTHESGMSKGNKEAVDADEQQQVAIASEAEPKKLSWLCTAHNATSSGSV